MLTQRIRRVFNTQLINQFRTAQSVSQSQTEIEVLPKQDAQVSQGAAGITVASVENYSPVSKVSVVIKAGSRYETGENMGISHALRNASTLSTKNQSAFIMTRNLELLGAKLAVTSSREHMIYSLQCGRDNIDPALEILSDVICNPALKPWELEDATHRLSSDLARHNAQPEAVLMEALHKAAYRGGLGNSLFIPPYMIGKHNSDMLQSFLSDYYTAPRTSVVGLGITHDHLQESVEKHLSLNSVHSGNEGAAKFGPGETRIEADLPFVYTAIVAEGAGLSNIKESLSLGVLQCILGLGSHTLLGGCAFSRLGEAAGKCTINPFFVSGLNINYSDTGLFGVYIAGHPDEMSQLVKAVVGEMKAASKSITDDAVAIGKHKLKAKLVLEKETSADLLNAMAIDVAHYGQIKDIKEILKAIDDIKTSDVSSIASKVVKAKPAMASLGLLHTTPHVDELI